MGWNYKLFVLILSSFVCSTYCVQWLEKVLVHTVPFTSVDLMRKHWHEARKKLGKPNWELKSDLFWDFHLILLKIKCKKYFIKSIPSWNAHFLHQRTNTFWSNCIWMEWSWCLVQSKQQSKMWPYKIIARVMSTSILLLYVHVIRSFSKCDPFLLGHTVTVVSCTMLFKIAAT